VTRVPRLLAAVAGLLVAALAALGLLAGCGDSSAAERVASSAPPQRQSPAALAGERVIYSYAGLRPPASLLSAIRAGEAAGVILFGANIASPTQVRAVISQLQGAARASPEHAKLLILADQEGGEVRRLPGAPLMSEKQIGVRARATALAGSAGVGAAQNLLAAGINVNLAPVLDVYRQPGNFIDRYQRSYSSNPASVARLGGAFISAQQGAGVAATGKHFPGLGAAAAGQNTDLGPVTLVVPLGTLRSVDEAPYVAAVAAGVQLVMSSWAIYPALDPRLPAGLSPLVIQGELRQRLRFKGVTITDAIGAGAVTAVGNLARRSVLAAAAGEDLILAATTNPYRNSPSIGIGVFHALASAIARNQLSVASSRQAAARVFALRARAGAAATGGPSARAAAPAVQTAAPSVQAAAPSAQSAAPTQWRPFVHVRRPLDLAAAGTIVLAAAGRLWSLTATGAIAPYASGYHSPGGEEPYVALSPGGCFGHNSVYALRLARGRGVTAIDEHGGVRRFATLTAAGLIDGIAFDTTGAFGRRLLVTINAGQHTTVDAIDCRGTVTPITRTAPRVEGGIAVAPGSFGRFAGDLIASGEVSGRVFAITPRGRSIPVVDSGLPHGNDVGVESEAFVPRGGSADALVADRLTPGNPHPGDDVVLRIRAAALAAAGVRPGDLLVATEGGALTDAIRCTLRGCAVRYVAAGPMVAHVEGHIAFAVTR
jgi:beta-N-acetylhexosaminidase